MVGTRWRHTSRGSCCIGGIPRSARWRYHSAQECVLVIREVEGVDHVAVLPAAVARRPRPKARVSTMWDLTQPRAGGVNRDDVERQRARPQTAPGDSSSETTRATWRTLPRAINSSGFWSSSASIGLDSQTGMYSASITRASRSTISARSATRSARFPVGELRRANQSRRVLGAAPTARPICASERCATSRRVALRR